MDKLNYEKIMKLKKRGGNRVLNSIEIYYKLSALPNQPLSQREKHIIFSPLLLSRLKLN